MNRILCAVSAAALLFGAAACGDAVRTTRSGLDPERFRTEIGGKPVALYTLTHDAGTEVCITNFGTLHKRSFPASGHRWQLSAN